jgi:hypothetical protein
MNVYFEEYFLRGSDITECFKDVYTKTDIDTCEYVVITSIDNKISLIKNELQEFLQLVKDKNKKVIFLGQGDIEEGYIPQTLGYNFKNNLFKSKKFSNEFSMTSLAPERTPLGTFTPYTKQPSIGFCGATDRFNRDYYLNQLAKSDLKTDFFIKNGPEWGTQSFYDCVNEQTILEVQKKAREVFYKNITNNLFTLCVRGWGNYSYRFCQTICLGRIPVLINTDCSLPFEEIFDYKNNIVIVEPGEDLVSKIKNFLLQNNNRLKDMQEKLYNFGNEYLTPHGYLRNLKKIITCYECNN